jgi:uncharacterized protein involved in exopolysaccharide biosynthesis
LQLRAFVQEEITKSVRELKAKVDFLGDQLNAVEADLTRAGAQRAHFRELNADRLPEDASLTQSSRHTLEARRADLLTTINQLQGELHTEQSQLQADTPIARTKFQSSESYRQSFAEVNRKLSEAYARGYNDGHPEIIRLKDEQQRLQALAKEELQSDTSALMRASDPNYQVSRRQIEKLQTELSAARTNLTETERSLGRVRDVEHDLPRIEEQLSELDHRQTATKQLHGELFSKLKQAEIQLNLEKVSAESRYDVTPPTLERPKRSTTLATRGAIGLFAGLLAAALFILLREGQRLVAQTLAPPPGLPPASASSQTTTLLGRRGNRRDSRF